LSRISIDVVRTFFSFSSVMAAQSQEMETAQKDVPATAGNALPRSLDLETSGRSGSKLVCQSGNVLYHQLSCGM